MTSGKEREIDSRLADWVDGTLTDRDRESFVAELRVSAQLRKDLAEYEKTVATLRAALQAPTAKTSLGDRVMAAIAAEREAGGSKPRRAGPFSLRQFAGDAVRSKAIVWSLCSAAALLGIALVLDTWPTGPKVELQAKNDSPPPRESLEELFAGARSSPEKAAGAAKERAEVRDQVAAGSADEKGGKNERKTDNPPPAAESVPSPVPSTPTAPAPVNGPGARGVEGPVTKRAVAPPEVKPGTPAELEKRRSTPGARTAGREPESRDRADAPILEQLEREAPRAADPDASRRFGQPPADERQRAESDSDKSGVAKSDRRAAAAPAGELLVLVVLQGDATDALERGDRSGSGLDAESKSRAANGEKSGAQTGAQTVEQLLDSFFANQMRAELAASATAMSLPPPSSLRLRPIEAEDVPKNDPAGATTGVAPLERTWLVEGSEQEVGTLLRRLGTFAKARNLKLTTGEQVVAPSEPVLADSGDRADRAGEGAKAKDSEAKTRAAATQSGTSRTAAPEPASKRLLLRFRLLRR